MSEIERELFDLDSAQEITIEKGQKRYVHSLNQPSLEQVRLFERKRLTPVEFRQDEINTTSNDTAACIYLYDLLAVSVSDVTGKDWKKKIPPLQKVAIAKALFKNFVMEPEDIRNRYPECQIEENLDERAIYIECFKNGKYIITSHLLKEPDEQAISEFQRIKALGNFRRKKNKVIWKSDVTVQEQCDLYDSLYVRAEGYQTKQEDLLPYIPVIHKVEALTELFAEIDEVIQETEKN